jgi:beta-lactamase class A
VIREEEAIMRIKIWGVAAVLLSTSGLRAETNLNKLLDAELSRFPAKAGVYVKHLGTGETAVVLGDDHFNSASVIKIPVMILAFRLAEQGKLNLNDRVEIKRSDLRGGSGIFRYQDVGLNPTLHDVITQMIITSDNTATDIMIAKVGGKDKVNEFLKQSGFTTTHLVQTVYELFRKRYEVLNPKYKSLTPEDVFALQSNLPSFAERRDALNKQMRAEEAGRHLNDEVNKLYNENEAHWLGVVTPSEIGRMLEGIEKATIASKQSCEDMKRIMRAQQSGARRIPHYLTVPVAHKTGDLGVVANDVGMVYAKSGTIIISFMTLGITGVYAETEDRIGQVSRMIVEYFDGAN